MGLAGAGQHPAGPSLPPCPTGSHIQPQRLSRDSRREPGFGIHGCAVRCLALARADELTRLAEIGQASPRGRIILLFG